MIYLRKANMIYTSCIVVVKGFCLSRHPEQRRRVPFIGYVTLSRGVNVRVADILPRGPLQGYRYNIPLSLREPEQGIGITPPLVYDSPNRVSVEPWGPFNFVQGDTLEKDKRVFNRRFSLPRHVERSVAESKHPP